MTSLYVLIPEVEANLRHLNLSIHTSFETCPIIDGCILVELLVKSPQDFYDNPKWSVFLDYRIFTKEELQQHIAKLEETKPTLLGKILSVFS